ncbi:MAG: TIGR03936 family radical SAM-associated protein [Eubacteriales bacterium]|nr:TIGR03936 family radical SAM-associated protein [Eubacteriales bacterium]
MKIWIRFGKTERLRYVSHLDLQRFMQRALNRTELPIAWSQGFNPHPLMSFGSAMAMGGTSEYEIFEIRMAKDTTAQETARQMAAALPPDLPVIGAKAFADSRSAPMAMLKAADYMIAVEGAQSAQIIGMLDEYMAKEHVMAMRKTKTGEKEADIRAMTHLLKPDLREANIFFARLSLTERATLKPDLLVRTLAQMAGVQEPEIRVHRLSLLGENEKGELKPLMEL